MRLCGGSHGLRPLNDGELWVSASTVGHVRLRGGFHGVLRTPLNDGEFEFSRPLLGVCASVGDPRFARMTEEAATLPRPR